jgi:hypothetical protein
MSKSNTKLTSVKILEALYSSFKVDTVNSPTNLQKLTNRCIHLYLTDKDFKERVELHDELIVSGSNF